MKLTIDQQTCIQCKKCMEICPMEAIGDHFGYVEIDGLRCVSCRLCLSLCPVDAIKIGLSYS